MEDVKTQLAQKLQAATNILVTVSSSPSVDQLAACIGMTLWLNKLGKHATAVFSGDIPNAIEFLQPEATIEKTTDSLRDFIIALDKSKADKLRYKVEDRVVKIFITPYRTNLSANDLEFSQGDFNIDAVVAIGVNAQEDLDNAIIAHGRILHDATVTSINTSSEGGVGSINWHETTSSSLSELVFELCQGLDLNQLDPQIATALLTGIVAETNRFSNNKTSSQTMSVAASLMSAGANQQLVANKLEEAAANPVPENLQAAGQLSTDRAASNDDDIPAAAVGTLEITHARNNQFDNETTDNLENIVVDQQDKKDSPLSFEGSRQDMQPAPNTNEPSKTIDPNAVEQGKPISVESTNEIHSKQRLVVNPPTMGGTLTANSRPDDFPEPTTDPFSLPAVEDQLLNGRNAAPEPAPAERLPATEPITATPMMQPGFMPQEQPSPGQFTAPAESNGGQTLDQIEHLVASPHIGDLRDQVQDALKTGPLPEPGPIDALNAINIDLVAPAHQVTSPDPKAFNLDKLVVEEDDEKPRDPNAPPQVPPPIVPPDFLPPIPPK